MARSETGQSRKLFFYERLRGRRLRRSSVDVLAATRQALSQTHMIAFVRLTPATGFWPAVAGLVVVLLVAPRMWRVIVPFAIRSGNASKPQAVGVWPWMPVSRPLRISTRLASRWLDIGLAQAIAARWGVQVQIEGVGFDGLVDAVQASRVDTAISALPTNPSLPRTWLFLAALLRSRPGLGGIRR